MKKLLALSLLLLATVSLSFGQSSRVKTLDYSTFESMLDESDDQDRNLIGTTHIIIDFTATWCQPCKAFAPTFDATSLKYAGKVDFYKVDIDQEPEIAEIFGITSIPTLVLIPVSGDIDKINGGPKADMLENMIDLFFEL